MLTSLSIRDFVLIEHLDLELESGLCVLTGETGAGKSILLDALGLCLGDRASGGLVRCGAQQADVTAIFELPSTHASQELLTRQGLNNSEELILRRVVTADGRSRAFANDRPVSATFLRELGTTVVEVQGQHDLALLLDSSNHRQLLDQYAGLEAQVAEVATAYNSMRAAEEALQEAKAELQRARADEDYLRHVVEELSALDPQPEEEDSLAAERSLLMHADRLAESLSDALAALTSEDGAQVGLRRAERSLERSQEQAAGRFEEAVLALGRAGAETMEAIAIVEDLNRELTGDPARSSVVEERLFDLRGLARKHHTVVPELPALLQAFAERLAVIDSGSGELNRLSEQASTCRKDYQSSAESLSTKRQATAREFDAAVNAELPPLKLGDAVFETIVETLSEERWGRDGFDRVAFQVTTGPGQRMGPLSKVASGGELSRIMLALKVVLSRTRGSRTLIFDEVDHGIGGATADAVGARLEQLAQDSQVLVVTHSPQVAARGVHHWLISKTTSDERASTSVDRLDRETRREELARMLAGARVTDEARAAADSLIAEQAS
jgi:DNA repair protein RecN (Recombination protein N)